MIKTGVLIEAADGAVKESSLGVLNAAAGTEVYALVMDNDVRAAIERLREYGAAKIVNIASSGDLSNSPDLQAEVLAEVAEQYHLDALLGSASDIGNDLFARLAAILDEPLLSDCVQVDIAGKKAIKSHFSGKVLARLKVNASIFLCTVRPNAIEAVMAPAKGEIIDFPSNAVDPELIKIVETKQADTEKVDLLEAQIVVTGGRGIKAAENFKMLEACADKIGAAIGASRAAVDAGYAPHSIQVGQTGKTVSPRLYIACGVSGAVQHFAGIKTAKVIVAINEDKDAPIFTKCDYGILGDIFKVIPALTEKL